MKKNQTFCINTRKCKKVVIVFSNNTPSAKNFKNLSNTQKHSDDGEYIHCTEEDCLFKVLWNHTLGEVKGLFQWAGITHEHGLNQKTKEMALQPKCCHLQDHPQKHRDYIKDCVDRLLKNVLLVHVFTCCIKMEHSPWYKYCYKL